MRAACLIGRLCVRQARPRIAQAICRSRPHVRELSTRTQYSRGGPGWRPPRNSIVLAAVLSPAAFIELSEEPGDGETGEERMLEASREELAATILYLLVDRYLIEPVATGFRFLHLVVIFVPLIITVPAIWLGPRNKKRENERSGKLWWYAFLVKSMERAGPAFIKVREILK